MNRKNLAAGLYLLACLVIPAFGTTLVTLVCTTLTATTATIARLTVGSLTISSTGTIAGFTATTATTTYLNTVTRFTNRGLTVFTSTTVGSASGATTGVYASTTIPVAATFVNLMSSGSLALMTSLPNISTSVVVGSTVLLPDGTLAIFTTTQAVGGLIFQDAGTLAGSGLQLGAATRTVDQYNTLVLIYNGTTGFWQEVAYIAN